MDPNNSTDLKVKRPLFTSHSAITSAHSLHQLVQIQLDQEERLKVQLLQLQNRNLKEAQELAMTIQDYQVVSQIWQEVSQGIARVSSYIERSEGLLTQRRQQILQIQRKIRARQQLREKRQSERMRKKIEEQEDRIIELQHQKLALLARILELQQETKDRQSVPRTVKKKARPG